MRIPYAPEEPVEPEHAAIYERIAARRSPRPLTAIDLALLHSPEIADAYNVFLGAIRTKSTLPLEIRELATCYIGVLNNASYEWNAHALIATKAGVSKKKLEAVLRGDVKNDLIFTEEETDVLRFTEQSTKNVAVDDDVFDNIKGRYTHSQVVELTMVVAGYNMVSRMLVALDVEEMNGKTLELPE